MNVDVVAPWLLLLLVTVISATTIVYLTAATRRLRGEGKVICGTHAHRWIDRLDEFVSVAADSGLVHPRRMRHLLAEFQKAAHEPFGDTITAFSTFLVSRDVLTCWQIEMLRRGQYKGFYEIPGFRLLDRLGDIDGGSTYLAERASGEVVALNISPHRVAGGIVHRVARAFGNRQGATSGGGLSS